MKNINFLNMNFKECATISVALLCVKTAYPADSLRTQKIKEVVVTADRTRRANVYETVPIQSVSGDDIRMTGVQSVADAVKRLAGANVKDYGGIGGMKTVSVRNLGAQHTAVSYDGVAVSNTQAGQIDIGRFSLDNVGLLTMAVGQGSGTMQSARHYASAAVLSIETERPSLDTGDYRLSSGIAIGSWGQVNPKLRFWNKISDKTMATIDANFMRADGRYGFTLVNGNEKTKEQRNNSDICQWHVEGNLFHSFNDGSQLAVKAYFYKSERGLPGTVILYNNISNERLWDENFFTQALYTKKIGESWKLAVRGKYTHSWNLYEDINVKYSGGILHETNRQDEYYISSTLGYSPVAWLEMAIAEDVAANKLRTSVNGSPNPFRITSLTALVAKMKTGRLTAEGNIVFTYASESLKESTKYAITTPADRKKISPSLSLSYRLLPDDALFFRTMVKSTFRLPTFNDLYYLQIGNTSLRPENAVEYGAGLTWNSRKIGAVKYVTATVDAYINNVTDKIVAFPSTYIWKMVNFGKVKAKGLDLTLGTQIDLSKGFSLTASGAMTLQEAKDKTENSPTYNSQLPYTPKVSGSLSAIFYTPWINIGYSSTAQGKRYSMAQNTNEYLMKSYMEHSLSVSRLFHISKSNDLTLQLTVNNITNKQYEIIKYYPMPGRSFLATVMIELFKNKK